ncbi:MAG TPA: tripartite tricarboxylate transporter substrate binding protein [Burkholderiales bacterium]|nr:tripartite tricarboxylate transporter substrate binding protein [Burkholderiales bacterium]
MPDTSPPAKTKRRLRWCAALLLAAAIPLHAQDYPRGAVTLVIPLAPGDATDTSARAIADELSRELKVSIIPVNRPGAGGAVGTESVVKAKPDGNTIILTNNASLVFRSILDPKTASYDPLTDLTPLGLAMRSPSILAVRGDAPYKTFAELVDHAKKNPGSVRVGTAGAGSVGEFCVHTINSLTGAGLVPVPFTGASPGVTALLGGHVEGVVLALGTMTGHLRSGTLRGLVISSKYPDFPEIPTLSDLGYSESLFGIWVAFFAPAGVPPEVSRALVPALERAINSPAIAAKLKPLGMVMDYSPPEKLLAEIRDEHRRVLQIAGKAGLVR